MADYFDTSVDYIIGHTEIRRKIEKTEVFHLNRAEADMLTRYRALTPAQKACIIQTIDTFLKH